MDREHVNNHRIINNYIRKPTKNMPEHSYSGPGVYHVVICAKGIEGRAPLFEHPVLVRVLQSTWMDLPGRYPGIQLDEFVIMPDHIHFIIWINKWPDRVRAERPPYLWEIIGAFKSLVAVSWIQYIKQERPFWSAQIWQKKYYEHVIRVDELNRVRRYIRENPDHLPATTVPNYVDWQTLYHHMGWKRHVDW